MDLADLCDSYVELKMVQMDTISLFLVPIQPSPATRWVPTILHPCSACGIGYIDKNLSKMTGNSASYPFNS